MVWLETRRSGRETKCDFVLASFWRLSRTSIVDLLQCQFRLCQLPGVHFELGGRVDQGRSSLKVPQRCFGVAEFLLIEATLRGEESRHALGASELRVAIEVELEERVDDVDGPALGPYYGSAPR